MSAINTYRVTFPQSSAFFSGSIESDQRISILSRQAPLSTDPSDSSITDWTFERIFPSSTALSHPRSPALQDVAPLDEEEEEKCDLQMGDQKDRYFSIQVSKDHPILRDSIYCQNASFLESKTSAGANHRTVLFPKKLFDNRLLEQLFTQGADCIFYDNFGEVVRIVDFIGSRSLIMSWSQFISHNIEIENPWSPRNLYFCPETVNCWPQISNILADTRSPAHLLWLAANERPFDPPLDLDSIDLTLITPKWIEWIARFAARNNNKDVMRVLIKDKRWNRDYVLQEAAKYDSHDVINVFLTDEHCRDYDHAIWKVTENLEGFDHTTSLTSSKKELLLENKLNTIKLLWPKVYGIGCIWALVIVAQLGKLQPVKALSFDRIFPKLDHPYCVIEDRLIVSCEEALVYIAKYGLVKALSSDRILHKSGTPWLSSKEKFRSRCTAALFHAADYGLVKIIIELLATKKTTEWSRSYALSCAAEKGFPEVVRVFLAHERVSRACITTMLTENYQNKEVIEMLHKERDSYCVIS